MIYNYFALVTFIANLVVAVFICLKDPKREINRVLSLIALCLSIWTFILFVVKFVYSAEALILLAKINFTVMTFCPFLILYFVRIFPNSGIRAHKELFWYFAPAPFIIVSVLSPFFITGAMNDAGQLVLERGWLHVVWAVYLLGCVLIALNDLIVKYVKSRALERLQIRYVLIGFFVMIIGSFITNVFFPILKVNIFVHYGPLFTLPFVVLLGYSIMKYRLLDIAVFIKKSIIYFILVTFITIVYVLLLLLTQFFFSNKTPAVDIFLFIVSAFVIALTIDPLKDWVGRATDAVFFKGKYNYYKVLKSLANTLGSVVKADELVVKVVDTIEGAMKLESASMFIIEKNSGHYVTGRTTRDAVTGSDSVPEGDAAARFLSLRKEPLVYDEIEYIGKTSDTADALKLSMENIKAKVLVPIILKDKLIGMLSLGGKRSEDIFTQEDLDLLTLISNQISVVLENTSLYEQMLSTAKLALVGTMAAGIAHEIRNPLQPIKLFIQQLPERGEDKEFLEENYGTIVEQLNRLDRLTEELLNFSRPKPRAYSKVDLKKCVENVLVLFERQFTKRSVDLKFECGDIPPVYADEEQIAQVLINLILNGVQAIQGKGVLRVSMGSESSESLIKYAVIKVADTGSGIPKQNIERIFEPFFTTKKEGTGLGLSICLKIVQEHNGIIQVSSVPGSGTTMKILLPAYGQNQSS